MNLDVDNDDIVEELRAWAEIITKSKGVATMVMLSGDPFERAADEIERLQADLAEALDIRKRMTATLNAVGDALFGSLRTYEVYDWDEFPDRVHQLQAEADEIERLQAKLATEQALADTLAAQLRWQADPNQLQPLTSTLTKLAIYDTIRNEKVES